MKRIVGILLVCLAGTAQAQEKETVHSIVVVRHDLSWYETQKQLWKAEVEEDESNGEAWYNYYSAVRAIRNLCQDDVKRKVLEVECRTIAESSYKAVPESFEANHLMYRDFGLSHGDINYLDKAYQINPNDSRIFDDVMIQAEMKGDKARFEEMAMKMYQENRLPAGMLNWGYNLLSELEPNAVVFVAGDNDTYALWFVQVGMNYRKDVQVVNTYMIREPNYCDLLMKEMGIATFAKEIVDGNFMPLYEHILRNKTDRQTYVSVSAFRQFDETDVMKDLYLTGLAYQYSEVNIDNMSLIRRNYEKRYLLDHLYRGFGVHIANERAVHFKGLYLPSLIKLCKHYASCEEIGKRDKMAGLIRQIGKEIGEEEDVEQQLKQAGC